MKRLSHLDGSWQDVQDQWSRQCHSLGEDFETYLPETLPMLADQTEQCERDKWTGVYAHADEAGEPHAVCFLNAAFIPEYSGRVLRVRHLVLAPKYDFEEFSEEAYVVVLADILNKVIRVSNDVMPCPHLKFHFRSPADLALFRHFSEKLRETEQFAFVKMIGSWLFITK